MFRVILSVEEIDYNALIDMVAELVKQNKDNPALKGMKIPAMGFSMVKGLPKSQKNSMLAMVVNQDKARTIQTLQSVLAARFGAAQVLDVQGSATDNGINLQADIGAFDFNRAIDIFLPRYLKNTDFNEALGDDEADKMSMDEFCRCVKELPLNDKEVVFLRSVRMKKNEFLADMESMAKAKGVSVNLTELKILVRR